MANNNFNKSINLNTYTYKGINSLGQLVSGECRGKTKSAAKAQMELQGIKIKKIVKKQKSIFEKRVIKDKEIVHFTRHLATMIQSGIPIVQSLDVCINSSENKQVAEMITKLKTAIQSGHSLSEAMSLYPKQFNNFYRNLLKIGESSGKLDVMLVRVADYLEKMNMLKAKFKKALMYPSMIVIVSLVVTSILLIYVVPQFESMFQNLNAELPAFTQLVLNISRILQAYWFYIFTAILILYYLLNKAYKELEHFQTAIDRTSLKIPIIGSILNKICLARFARTLTTMLSSGIPLLNSLPAAEKLVGNKVYSHAIHNIMMDIENGLSLNRAMQKTDCFNHMIIQMTAIGENSGALDEMLLRIATLYEEEVDDTVANLSSIIEPLIIVLISVIVGGLIIAMYLPIFSLGAIL